MLPCHMMRSLHSRPLPTEDEISVSEQKRTSILKLDKSISNILFETRREWRGMTMNETPTSQLYESYDSVNLKNGRLLLNSLDVPRLLRNIPIIEFYIIRVGSKFACENLSKESKSTAFAGTDDASVSLNVHTRRV